MQPPITAQTMFQKPFILALETSSRFGSAAIGCGEKLLAEAAFSGPLRHSPETFPAISGLLERFGKKPQEIEHIYISVGPGSFTGLRIAVTIAKTMHLANAAKIVAVDSLDVLASNVITLSPDNTAQNSSHVSPVTSCDRIAAVLDAKRSQFFIAVYERSPKVQKCTDAQTYNHQSPMHGERSRTITNHEIWKKNFPDSVMTASEFLDKFAAADKPIWLLGDGLLFHKDKFKAEGVQFLNEKYWSPRAEKVHLLGWQLAKAGRFADPLTLTPNYLLRPDIKIKPR